MGFSDPDKRVVEAVLEAPVDDREAHIMPCLPHHADIDVGRLWQVCEL